MAHQNKNPNMAGHDQTAYYVNINDSYVGVLHRALCPFKGDDPNVIKGPYLSRRSALDGAFDSLVSRVRGCDHCIGGPIYGSG